MEPFLKWAGGKRWLIPKIKDQIPEFRTYYEPFLGSGALFFALSPKSAVLSDANPELINCYRQVRNQCRSVIKILKQFKQNKRSYYSIRKKFNFEKDLIKKSAYFIYLNKMCWNGLYRVNRMGKFNVPIGKHLSTEYKFFDEEHLLSASRLLKKAELLCGDFEDSVKQVRSKKDFVYFDPPYITTHLKNGFIKYNSVLFNQSDELRLSELADKLVRRGVKVIVSNAAHPLIKQQYNGIFYKTKIDRASLIAGDPHKRSRFVELLVTSFPMVFEISRSKNLKQGPRVLEYEPAHNSKYKM